MAANAYYNTHIPAAHEQQQHLLAHASPLGDQFSQSSTPLKPLHFFSETGYHNPDPIEKHNKLQSALHEDAALKSRIRRFRILSRALSFLISLGVLTPISLTLAKFLQTQNTHRTVTLPDGSTTYRTAWAHDSRTWPTYAYFAVTLTSTALDFGTILSYRFGVGRANTAAYIASVFAWLDMLGNAGVWVAAAVMYRTEKNKHGRSDDLWGWTCSPAARAIQREFVEEIDFDKYCNVQSASWYVGLARAAAALLTVGIYVLVCRRRQSKRRVERLSKVRGKD